MRAVACTFAIALLAACSASDADGEGSIAFSTWGESFIENEIPAAAVEDGWTIRYAKYLVVLRDIKVQDLDGAVAAEMRGGKLFDMTRPGVKPVIRFDGVPGKAWQHVSYEIGPAAADTELGAATEADKALMLAGGFSLYVDAVATKGNATKKYAWGFKTTTLFDHCRGEIGGKDTDGVVVTNGGTDQPQITIHGDHLYYDDLQSKDAKVRFDNIAAADADADGIITLEELGKVKLAAIPRDRGPYGTGSAAHINDLAAFVTALSRTVGHFRGEGECFASPR